ncbi:response regulator [Thermithiobacillus plumbiphilus]|uniref:histidine kinase n=1 Tax=Thermithiobacillus plumbiphilus TaxID=1729899 RepID=A0ABU9DB39_9PROT
MDMPLPAINRLFASNLGLGRTGEMVICGPRLIAGRIDTQNMRCMPHRFRPQGALTPYVISGTQLPMTQAFQGRAAVIQALDYRRHEVIDAFAPIGSSGLGMVLKIDKAELYAPVSRQMQLLIPLLLAIVLGGILLLRRLTLPLLRAIVHSEGQASESNERLRQSEERYRSVVESAREGIVTADSNGRITYMNAAAGRMFGQDPEEMRGQSVTRLMPARYQEQHEGHMQRFAAGAPGRIMGTQVELEGLRKSGEEFPLELSLTYWQSSDGMHFTSIMRDISERKAVERMKNEFVSTVSHELRTPLTSIRGSLGLLSGGVAGELPAQSKQLVKIALSNSERLSNLINDILDIEKIESGKLELQPQVLPLAPLLRQAVTENAGYASAFDCTLVLQESFLDTKVRVDPDRLMQILANLLSNAAKFSPKGGQVSVHTELTVAGQVRITVCDQGPGVPENFHERIFQKFAQADASDTRSKGGTGLGLSISRALAQAMQGRIGFINHPEGGACFHLELPCLDHLHERAGPELGRILICEDDPDVAHLLSLMLREGGFACDLAFSASQAKQQLATGKYMAMTLDIMLPDQDGISFLRELRAQASTRHLPIVVVSAKAAAGRQELNGDAFAIVDWLSKPIDQKRLLDGLHQALKYSASEKPCILHVEDDPDIRQLIAIMLGNDAEIVAAGDAAKARQAMAARRYHLVILDLGLPDDPGSHLLAELRQYQPLTPVLVFSSQELSRELSEQVAGLLIKSRTSHELLLDSIRKLLHRQAIPMLAEIPEKTA